MSPWEVLLTLGSLLLFVGAVILLVWLLRPMVDEVLQRAQERARIEREVQRASWRIHQQATQAFGQMLDAARQAQRQEERP